MKSGRWGYCAQWVCRGRSARWAARVPDGSQEVERAMMQRARRMPSSGNRRNAASRLGWQLRTLLSLFPVREALENGRPARGSEPPSKYAGTSDRRGAVGRVECSQTSDWRRPVERWIRCVIVPGRHYVGVVDQGRGTGILRPRGGVGGLDHQTAATSPDIAEVLRF